MTPGEEINAKLPVRLMLASGLMVGTLDGTAAIVDFLVSSHGDPRVVFRYIASGILGFHAFSGGFPVALLGIAFHYVIAMSWTILFFITYPRFRLLRHHWLPTGVAYAMVIWIVMNFVIRPLSLVPHLPWTLFKVVKSYLILAVVVGPPITYTAKRGYADSSSVRIS